MDMIDLLNNKRKKNIEFDVQIRSGYFGEARALGSYQIRHLELVNRAYRNDRDSYTSQ